MNNRFKLNIMEKKKVMVVEDSFIVAHHLKATLENEGYQVVKSCGSGEEAVEAAPEYAPDIILMDIMLQGEMDGIQTAARINEFMDVPVVYITALSDRNTIHKAKLTEPYGYLNKPFEDSEIFTVLEMALYKHQIQSRLRNSEEKYFSTVNSISDVVITIDRDCLITYMNPSAEKLTGKKSADVLGKVFNEVFFFIDSEGLKVNPLHCPLDKVQSNRMSDSLMLEVEGEAAIPIGESSLSPMIDSKGSQIGLIIVFKDIRDRKAQEKLNELMEHRQLVARVEGQEQERSRISMELHDGLGQMLNAVKMKLKSLLEDSDDMREITMQLNEAINESVRISENLLPSRLKNFSLDKNLLSLCKQIEKSHDLEVDYEGMNESFEVTQKHKIHIYRIAQEAMNNIVKHAQAKKVVVQVTVQDDLFRMSIEDDGIGLESVRADELYGNKGVVNMKDRAEILGGQLTIESDPKYGTMILLEIPTEVLISKEYESNNNS